MIRLVYFRASEGKVLIVWGLGVRLSRAMAAAIGTLGWVAQLMPINPTRAISNWLLIKEIITYKNAESIHYILKSIVQDLVLSTINQCNNYRQYHNLLSQPGVEWIT